MSTDNYTDLRYRMRIDLFMEPTDGPNELAISGAHDLAAAMALINAGLELFLLLGDDNPIAVATARALVAQMPKRFDKAIRDSGRPRLAVVVAVPET